MKAECKSIHSIYSILNLSIQDMEIKSMFYLWKIRSYEENLTRKQNLVVALVFSQVGRLLRKGKSAVDLDTCCEWSWPTELLIDYTLILLADKGEWVDDDPESSWGIKFIVKKLSLLTQRDVIETQREVIEFNGNMF